MTQGELFADDALAAARAGRDAALERVMERAGDEWKSGAVAWLAGYLRAHPTYFPDTDNRLYADQPEELRAWGGVTQHALRKGWIRRTDQTRPRTRGHCTPGTVYRSLLYRG